jgi:uncharacterized cupin superfamily protein
MVSFWPGGLTHWDEVPSRHNQLGHLSAHWRNLGTAAGSIAAGVKRIDVVSGKWSTPAHCQLAEEEIFYVLRGSGLLWQDDAIHEIGAGDCLVFRAAEQVHTLRAGVDGLDVLAFGTRVAVEVGELPRAGVGWLGPTWTEVGGGDPPWAREVSAGEPPVGELAPRPANVVNVGDERFGEGAWRAGTRKPGLRQLGAAAGSEQTGLNHETLAPGKLSAPPHCHSAEEEIFAVLEGGGTLELTPAPLAAERGAESEEHELRRGTVIARPAGTKIAHALRAGDSGMTYLAYGTREPNDLAYYPRSQKIYFRGLGIIARVEHLDYWDGEDDV